MEDGSIVVVLEMTGSSSVELEMTGSNSVELEMTGSNSVLFEVVGVLECMDVAADSNSVVIEMEEIADSSLVGADRGEIADSNSVLGEVGVVALGPSGDKMVVLVEVGTEAVVCMPAHGAVSSVVHLVVGVVLRVQVLPNTHVDYFPTV